MTAKGLRALGEMLIEASSGKETDSYAPAHWNMETDEDKVEFEKRNKRKHYYKVNGDVITCKGSAYNIEQFEILSKEYKGEIKQYPEEQDYDLMDAIRKAPSILRKRKKMFVGYKNGVIYDLKVDTDTPKSEELTYEEYNPDKHSGMINEI